MEKNMLELIATIAVGAIISAIIFWKQFAKYEEQFRERIKKMTREEIITQRNKTFLNYIGLAGMITLPILCLMLVFVPPTLSDTTDKLMAFVFLPTAAIVFIFQKFKYKQINDKVIDEILSKPKEKKDE